jgi:hypothetical protein
MQGTTLVVGWDGHSNFDHYNFRWGRPGKAEQQFEVNGGNGGSFKITNAHRCTNYTLKVQGCNKGFLSSSTCTPWEEQQYAAPPDRPYGPDTCASGFVWRDAFANDHVCVNPATRDQVAGDNRVAASRRSPNGGPYGPDTCLAGFVWREARPSDHICVPPAARSQAAQDNAAKCSRIAKCG